MRSRPTHPAVLMAMQDGVGRLLGASVPSLTASIVLLWGQFFDTGLSI